MSEIPERQNTPTAQRAARAFQRRYTLARRWRRARLGGAFLLGTAGVALSLLVHSTVDYVAAAAAAWTVLSRVWLERMERARQAQGTLAHETFDTYTFGLPWNKTAAGAPPAPEDLHNWGEHADTKYLRDWYADVSDAVHPTDVLICQRSSLTWARQDHLTYANLLQASAAAVIIASVALGVALNLSLGDYLLRLGIPLLPAILDIVDVATTNTQIGQARQRIAHEADELFAACQEHATPPTPDACRRIQDETYASRRAIGVPQWFYRSTRSRRQRNMTTVVQEQVAELPANLRR